MTEAHRKSPPCFFNRLRGGCAAITCLFLYGMFLGCTTPDGAVDRGTVSRSPRPIDADPHSAELIGREALAKIGYLPIIDLARRAGWVTTKEIRRPIGGDRSLISMDVAQIAAASVFVEVFSKYAVAAGVTSQADTPLPGPADVVAIGILVIGLIDAGILAGTLLRALGDVATAATSSTMTSPPAAPKPDNDPNPEGDTKTTGPSPPIPPEPPKRPPRCEVEYPDVVICSDISQKDRYPTLKEALEAAIKKLPRDRQKRPFTTRGKQRSRDLPLPGVNHTTYYSADNRTKISIGCYKTCCENTEDGPDLEDGKCYELNTEDLR